MRTGLRGFLSFLTSLILQGNLWDEAIQVLLWSFLPSNRQC